MADFQSALRTVEAEITDHLPRTITSKDIRLIVQDTAEREALRDYLAAPRSARGQNFIEEEVKKYLRSLFLECRNDATKKFAELTQALSDANSTRDRVYLPTLRSLFGGTGATTLGLVLTGAQQKIVIGTVALTLGPAAAAFFGASLLGWGMVRLHSQQSAALARAIATEKNLEESCNQLLQAKAA
jgi:hypothetical protein